MTVKLEFLHPGLDMATAYTGSYDPILVVASFVVATLAAYTALQVGQRLRAHPARAALWHTLGAGAMGLGIWGMHFVGMLALRLPVPVRFDPVLTLVSAVPALLASVAALHVIRSDRGGFWWVNGGGVLLGTGIGAMHYIGMMAMITEGRMYFDTVLFVSSILVAHVLATASLYARFALRGAGVPSFRREAGAAAVMGCAVACMHYTGMAATHYFPPLPGQVAAPPSGVEIEHGWMKVLVVIVPTALLIVAIVSARLDRRIRSILGESRRGLEILVDIGVEVQQMAESEDLGRLVRDLSRHFRRAGIEDVAIHLHRLHYAASEIFQSSQVSPDGSYTVEMAPKSDVFRVWRSGKTVYRPDLDLDAGSLEETTRKEIEARLGFAIRSIVDVPHLRGTLSLMSRHPGAFPARKILFIESVAGILSLAVARVEALEKSTLQAEAMREADRRLVFAETAGAAAHEINQPLSVIQGTAQILLAELREDGRFRDDLEAINKGCREISAILSKMGAVTDYGTRDYVGDTKIADFGNEKAASPATPSEGSSRQEDENGPID